MSKTTYHTPEKIVIVAGPSFGQALKFMLLGAAIGYGAASYLRPKGPFQAPRTPKNALQDLANRFITSRFDKTRFDKSKGDGARTEGAKTDGFKTDDQILDAEFAAATGGDSDSSPSLIDNAAMADRLEALTSRLKSIGSRAKKLVETASEAVKPTLETALAEGKRVAAEVQTGLKKEVSEAGDKPAIAEQDGELPSEKEDKYIE